MRCLGELEGQRSVEKFVAHLLTLGIDTHVEAQSDQPDAWELWVKDEDRLEEALRELEAFRAASADPKYDAAVVQANKLIEEKVKARKQAEKNMRRVEHSTARPPLLGVRGGWPPLTLTIFVLCILLGLLTNFGKPGRNNDLGRTIVNQLSFVAPVDYNQSDGDPAASLKRGQVWRAITPIFLHGSIWHLAMNMFVLVLFGRLLERWIGTPQFALMILLLAVVPNLFQGLSPEWMHGNPFFVGISGVTYGLFGYVWVRSSLNPSYGIMIPFPMIMLAVGLIVVGLSGAIPNWYLADLCHLGGLLVGAALGFASEQQTRS